MPEMKIPGPDHPITIAAPGRRLTATFKGHAIADSSRALILKESSYRAVAYFPREDVSMEFLSRTERTTYCPYKGEANYFSLFVDGELAENAVWTYETPYPAMDLIRGRVAFYPDKVEVHGVGEAVEPAIDAAIQHTDAGDGHAQKPV